MPNSKHAGDNLAVNLPNPMLEFTAYALRITSARLRRVR